MQQKYGRQHFEFLSDSFTIPEQREKLMEEMEREPGSYWIVKPPGEIHIHLPLKPEAKFCVQGKNNGSGIFVINKPEDIPDTEESVLVQKYITNPYLIRSVINQYYRILSINKIMYVVRRCKFDLRVYVLLTGVDPLKIYVYDEGLVRFDQKLQRLYILSQISNCKVCNQRIYS